MTKILFTGLLGAGLFFSVPAEAQLLGTTARQLPKGSLKLLTYYESVEDQAILFKPRPLNGACATINGVAFSCTQNGEVEAEGSGRMLMTKLVYQPWDSFQYYASVGFGDYDFKYNASGVPQDVTGDTIGNAFYAGLKWTVIPDTVVTPAIAVDASVGRRRHYFNRRYPGLAGQNSNITQRLDLVESQIAVQASHLFDVKGVKLEPYGGLQWQHVWADLKDLTSGDHAAGAKSVVRPMMGLRAPIFEKEALFAEASFVGGTRFATGLEVRFK
jgi:hypothetical protein